MLHTTPSSRARITLARAIAGACLILASAAAQTPTPDVARDVAQRARVELISGTKVLFLSGTDRERGFDEGYLLCDELVQLIDGFCLDPAVMPSPLVWKMLVRPRILKTMQITPRLRERCEGMLAGMQARRGGGVFPERLGRALDADDLIAVSALPDLMGLLCSSFAAWDAASSRGSTLVGRNLDYLTTAAICETVMLKVHAAAEDRMAWVEIGWPGALGCLTGYSEAGVYLAIHDVRPKGAKKEGLFTPRAHSFQSVLEQLRPSADLGERAAELLRTHRFIMGGNGMLAWSAPQAGGSAPVRGAAVLELDDRYETQQGVSVRRSVDDSYIACSNHHRDRATHTNCRRYRTIVTGLATTSAEPLDVASAWKLISSASVNQTLYRLVLDLEGGTLELDRRASTQADDWKERARFDLRALLARSKVSIPSTVPPTPATPAGSGG